MSPLGRFLLFAVALVMAVVAAVRAKESNNEPVLWLSGAFGVFVLVFTLEALLET